jgi:Fe-S cluster assembly protein SufD
MMLELNHLHYQQQFAKAKNVPRVSAWARNAQAEAFDRLLTKGLPSQRVEDWKYTDLTLLAGKTWLLSEAATEFNTELSLPAHQKNLVFVDGYFCEHLSSLKSSHDLEITSLQQSPHVMHEISEDIIDDLNQAFMTDGLLIKINSLIEEPIHLYHFNQSANVMNHVRHWIIAEPSSQATLIEHHVGAADIEYFTTAVTHLHCKENSNITHYKLQQESPKAYHLSQVISSLEANSTLQQFKFDSGSRLARTNNTARLLAPGAHCQLAGLYITKQQQHVDNHTLIHHLAPHTTSNEFYEGILTDRSRAVFNGRVIVQQDAQKISAEQTNKNLLLSKHAEIDTKPQLEIYADDVKCSHGATVGQLDEEALFYLQSRGIGEEQAKQALIFGFAKAVLSTITHQDTRLMLEKLTLPELNQSSYLEDLL